MDDVDENNIHCFLQKTPEVLSFEIRYLWFNNNTPRFIKFKSTLMKCNIF